MNGNDIFMMRRVWVLILFVLAGNIATGQKHPTQVRYGQDANSACGNVILGSGFEKSGMVRYVARPKIVESKWSGRQLTIKIFVVSECCPPDYLGYVKQADTLILYYGDKKNIPTKNGSEEIGICMCGNNGCCYEFEYRIKGLNRNTNYLVAASPVLYIGRFKPYPLGYTDGRNKSIYYSAAGDSLETSLDTKINDAVSHYKMLGNLYDLLIEQHNNENSEERATIDEIEKNWIKYFKCKEAIYDEFVKSKLNASLYNSKIGDFESRVLHELKILEPKLNTVSKYLHAGGIDEPIKELKVK
jgi:hypothetical protein